MFRDEKQIMELRRDAERWRTIARAEATMVLLCVADGWAHAARVHMAYAREAYDAAIRCDRAASLPRDVPLKRRPYDPKRYQRAYERLVVSMPQPQIDHMEPLDALMRRAENAVARVEGSHER